MTDLPPSPFINDPDHRFVLDEAAFMVAIDPAPVFLRDPSPEFMNAAQIMPVLKVLAHHI